MRGIWMRGGMVPAGARWSGGPVRAARAADRPEALCAITPWRATVTTRPPCPRVARDGVAPAPPPRERDGDGCGGRPRIRRAVPR